MIRSGLLRLVGDSIFRPADPVEGRAENGSGEPDGRRRPPGPTAAALAPAGHAPGSIGLPDGYVVTCETRYM